MLKIIPKVRVNTIGVEKITLGGQNKLIYLKVRFTRDLRGSIIKKYVMENEKVGFRRTWGLKKVAKSQESMNISLEGYVHGFLRLGHFFKAPSSSKTNFFIFHNILFNNGSS